MNETNTNVIVDRISKSLHNKNYDAMHSSGNALEFSNRNIMFEQYRLLVDSAHKIEERRGGSNNIFIGINTILMSILAHPEQLAKIGAYDISLLPFLTLIGILISLDWLKVIASYKRLNSLNYSLIESFENLLPTYVFSLRGKMETEQSDPKPSSRANIILISENLLPKAFLSIYSIYLAAVLIMFLKSIF